MKNNIYSFELICNMKISNSTFMVWLLALIYNWTIALGAAIFVDLGWSVKTSSSQDVCWSCIFFLVQFFLYPDKLKKTIQRIVYPQQYLWLPWPITFLVTYWKVTNIRGNGRGVGFRPQNVYLTCFEAVA